MYTFAQKQFVLCERCFFYYLSRLPNIAEVASDVMAATIIPIKMHDIRDRSGKRN